MLRVAMLMPPLQWGHVVVDVEGDHATGQAGALRILLQWGHVVVDVEGVVVSCMSLSGALASMGPRRRRRGRTQWATKPTNHDPLQWGHVVVDVEGRRRAQTRWPSTRRFNGATSSSTWKGPRRAAGSGSSASLQWGHVVVDVEGDNRCFPECLCKLASMGPRRRRRGRPTLSPLSSPAPLLQWGHVVVDVEGRHQGRPQPRQR